MDIRENDIAFTKVRGDFGWLGNLSRFKVEFEDKIWPSTEHLFQAMRFTDESIREAIRAEKNPYQSKQKAYEFADKMNFDNDNSIMELCVRLKITQHRELREQLIETGDRQIYEDVTNRGDGGSNLIWGAMRVEDKWVGQNILGNVWMKIRKELQDKSIF